MITLTGQGYWSGYTIVFGKCSRCKELASGVLDSTDPPLSIKCTCLKEKFSKPPLYYLKKIGLPMIVYALIHNKTNKTFVGTIITNDSNAYKKIEEEIEYLRDFKTFMIDPRLKKDLKKDGIDSFTIKHLSSPTTLSRAMVDEKLYISSYGSLKPDGYNTGYILETLTYRALKSTRHKQKVS